LITLRRSMVLSLLSLLFPRSGVTAGHQDRATAVPDMKVLLENEHVRVQFHDVKVGETTPSHSHPRMLHTYSTTTTRGSNWPMER
jgi:hypothetical protein